MSVQLCADAVARADPVRFRAIMAAPVATREVLFPIAAFAHEVARAPWVTQEPMIAQMRLQWWRDVLEEIAAGNAVRHHEVATPLAGVIGAPEARALAPLIEAREWDIERAPHADEAAFRDYLDGTSAIVPAALIALRVEPSLIDAVQPLVRAGALARYFQAVPALEAAGRIPLVDGRAQAVAEMARAALDEAGRSERSLRALTAAQRAPLIDARLHLPLLKQAARDPGAVAEGRLALREIALRWRLVRLAFR